MELGKDSSRCVEPESSLAHLSLSQMPALPPLPYPTQQPRSALSNVLANLLNVQMTTGTSGKTAARCRVPATSCRSGKGAGPRQI